MLVLALAREDLVADDDEAEARLHAFPAMQSAQVMRLGTNHWRGTINAFCIIFISLAPCIVRVAGARKILRKRPGFGLDD